MSDHCNWILEVLRDAQGHPMKIQDLVTEVVRRCPSTFLPRHVHSNIMTDICKLHFHGRISRMGAGEMEAVALIMSKKDDWCFCAFEMSHDPEDDIKTIAWGITGEHPDELGVSFEDLWTAERVAELLNETRRDGITEGLLRATTTLGGLVTAARGEAISECYKRSALKGSS